MSELADDAWAEGNAYECDDPKPAADPLCAQPDCKHEWETRHESWPCGAGMHTDSYEVCAKCGTVQDQTVPTPDPTCANAELKDCAFGEMLWPFPNHQLGWRMRYAPQNLTPKEFMRAARELDAYARLIALPQRRRNEICSEIQKGPNA